MANEVDFFRRLSRPEVDREDKVGCVNVTGGYGCQLPSSQYRWATSSNSTGEYGVTETDLISISCFVCASFTTRRMQGGDVIGRRSYHPSQRRQMT